MGLLNNLLHKKDADADQKKSSAVKTVKSTKKVASVAVKKDDHKHDKKTVVKEPAKSKLKLSVDSAAYRVLVRPLVTEKSAVAESKNKYSFVVSKAANKSQVRQAIGEIYGVKPSKINIVNIDGRSVRFGRGMGRRSDYKKAIVTLPTGSTIDIHAGV